MARAGRKRKGGRRQPSGKLAPEKRPDDRVRIGRQPHRRGLKTKAAQIDERAESPLGRLWLRRDANGDRLIDDEQLDAGDRYATLVWSYRAMIGAPRVSAGSGPGYLCRVEAFDNPSACRDDPDGCICRRRGDSYMRAFEALHEAGRAAILAVNGVAIRRDEVATEQDLIHLRAGLSALARHFGLTASRRIRTVRNTF